MECAALEADVAASLLPVADESDPFQRGITRNAAGWVVDLVNNDSVVESGRSPAQVVSEVVARVSLAARVPWREAREWRTGKSRSNGIPVLREIPPGETRFVEFIRWATRRVATRHTGWEDPKVAVRRPNLPDSMASSRNKTQPTQVDAETYIARIPDEIRRRDCGVLVDMMRRATGCGPKMWGPSIVGFDEYHYRYESGREGDSCVVGFSSGSAHMSLYLLEGFEYDESKALLSRLGKHRTAKVCLYIKRLSDVDLQVLEQLVIRSVADIRRRYPKAKP